MNFDFSFYHEQWLFISCLGINYLFAFGSLYFQLMGLYGARGITPIKEIMATKKGSIWNLPTVFWYDTSDRFIKSVVLTGIVSSVLIIFNILPVFFLIVAWFAYLSFMVLGSSFLSFQWDCLLLEVGFAGIFFAMLAPPPLMMVLLLWVILFKLMFSSGVVKILSGCPAWKARTALDYHYETQPLPNRIAYYVHQQPKWFARWSVYLTFFLELVVPFFIFGTYEMRLVACVLIALLQILIMLTGNYAFFNTLTLTLCIPLLSDNVFGGAPEVTYNYFEWGLYSALSVFACAMIVINGFVIARLFAPLPGFTRFWQRMLPSYAVCSYGLFARMTTVRNEIVVEGSNDGHEWRVYEFKWKPGDLKAAPRQVAPHQPRLDWQMWFAALGSYQYNPWLLGFIQRLLEGSPEVLGLIKTNPFPEKPPQMIRCQFYQYHFSDLGIKAKTGDWWVRVHKGLYTPVFNLKR